MKELTAQTLPALFDAVAAHFLAQRDRLCEMDAAMGDGDLGLTMSKGFGALPALIRQNMDAEDLGKTLMRAGMKMASVVPSTMGTLMSSGIMAGGKALLGSSTVDAAGLAAFLTAFAQGVQSRGKCSPGDRTVLDALFPAAQACRALDNPTTLDEVITAAQDAAAAGVEATKQMVPKFGKAAVFSAKALGVADQGAVAGLCLLQGMGAYILEQAS